MSGRDEARPNFFIVGAMKSGTSSLHRYLQQHEQVFMCEPKEPCYFVEREQLDWPAIEKLGLWREDRYLALFRGAEGKPVVGESSTLYTKLPRISGVAERIARFEPAARIAYVMRDPVERSISHYWHAVRWEKERRGLLEAIEREPEYLDVSYYAMQLRPYLRLFGQERVFIATTEELARDPLGVCRRLCGWLGVDPELVPSRLTSRQNVTPDEVVRVRGLGLLERLRWSRAWSSVGPWVPPGLRRLGRQAATRKVARKSLPTAEAESRLRELQLPQVLELQELLDRSFEHDWQTLFGAARARR